MASSSGGTSSGLPPAASTFVTYASGVSAAGTFQTPQVASSAYAVMPMTGRILSALSLIALALGLAACGGDGGSTTATETTTTFDTDTTVTTTETTPETTKLRVYFLLDGKVQPVAREVPRDAGGCPGGPRRARRRHDCLRGRARA